MKIVLRFHEINPPSARSFVLTPIKLLNKNTIINPQNKDDKCFLYATAYLFIMTKLIKNIQIEDLKDY